MIRVLVVDDHPVLRAGLEAVLRAEPGFACVGVAADGPSLLVALRRTPPDVVVLDRHLGDEDGLQLCEQLRAQPAAPEVVIYTADPDAAVREQAAAAGACAVIVKDADVDRLFDALRLAVRPRRSALA
jgi:DNA-binding NarL/FixJ family response regulator